MKKRALSLILALVLVLGLLPAVSAATLDSGLVYEVMDDHVEITGYEGDATEIVIPNEIEELPVTCIGEYAFSGNKNLIGITIPDSVTSIGKRAFYNCRSLVNINIPTSLVSIGEYAFCHCQSLTSLILPSSLSSIGDNAFIWCNSMTDVQVDIDNEVFSSQDGILYSKDMSKLIWCPGGKEGNIVIPESVTIICNVAFFYCRNLTSITIPAGVAEIGKYAFSGCTGLTDFQVHIDNETFCTQDGVLYSKDMTELVCCPGGRAGLFTIPSSVTHIGSYAFRECDKLTNITIPDSVTSIGDFAFADCEKLENVIIPDGITIIDGYTFRGCASLTSIVIPDGVTSIRQYAFNGCENLSSITIPTSVTSIDTKAFNDCDNLSDVYYTGTENQWSNIAIEENNDDLLNAVIHFNAATPTTNPFTDVPSGSFYEAPVLWALENGITTGATAATFNPNGSCLRAQVVTFLHRAAENPEPTKTDNPFSDVKSSDFFYKPVLWAVEKGITNGISTTKFGSYDVCNRAAVVTFLWRAAGSPTPELTEHPFKDIPAGVFYETAVLWALENGITQGISTTEFGPTSPCNRAQVVTFLYRAYN